MSKRLQDSLVQQKRKTEQVNQQIPGTLGIPLDGQRRVEVPGRNAFVFVKLRSNQSEVIQAYNNKVAPSYNLPVLVERVGGRYEVVGVDTQRYDNNWNSYAPFLPRHGNTHSFDPETGGGGDVVWVYPRQFMPALVLPSGSVGAENLIVSPYTLQKSDGTWMYVGNTGTANISQHRPLSTGAIMALVYLDVPSGNPYVAINSGSVFINSITGSSQVYPYIPTVSSPATQIPLAAVRLISGTSRLSWNNIYDVRQWIHTTPSGSAGGGGGGIDTIGIAGQDEGVNVGTGTVLNVTGAGATLSRSGTVLNLDVPGGGVGGSGLGVMTQDEGVPLGTGLTLNFVGSNVDASISGSVVRVFVTGSTGGSAAIFGPQSFGQNYIINSTSVSGSLVVSLKTMNGTNPTASDKITLRIANNNREVTSALSTSIPTGTNWFNAGSSELAGQTIEYFVYAVWNESGGGSVELGLSRYPFGEWLLDFSSTGTSQAYMAGVTYNSDYRVENIGRIRAVLSASPGYAWTHAASVYTVSHPIYETGWLFWQPTYSANGSMTWTTITTVVAKYRIKYKSMNFYVRALGTIGGTPSTQLNATLPLDSPQSANSLPVLGSVIDGGGVVAFGFLTAGTPDQASGRRYDGANFSAGASRGINLTGLDVEVYP